MAALDEAMAATRADGTPVAVAYFDLDGFKEVNDGYGHETGDHLLRRVAEGFKLLCQDQVLARIGGDEFALIIAGDNAAKIAADIGWAMIGHLNRPFEIDGRIIAVGTSVGIAAAGGGCFGGRAASPRRRRHVSGQAAGPNRLFAYDALIDTIRHERLRVADDLRKALHSDSLDVAYQPVFDAHSPRWSCVEALLRWTRPGFGPMSPSLS